MFTECSLNVHYSYCPLAGVPPVVHRLLAVLTQRTRGGFRLGEEDAEILARVNVWTRCLGAMAARALHLGGGEGVLDLPEPPL